MLVRDVRSPSSSRSAYATATAHMPRGISTSRVVFSDAEMRKVLLDLGRHAVPGLGDALVKVLHDLVGCGLRGRGVGVLLGPLDGLVHRQDRSAVPLEGLGGLVAADDEFTRRPVQAA